MRHVAIFHQMACVLSQITKKYSYSNQYIIAHCLNRIVCNLNRIVDAIQIAIQFCPSLVRTVAPRSSTSVSWSLYHWWNVLKRDTSHLTQCSTHTAKDAKQRQQFRWMALRRCSLDESEDWRKEGPERIGYLGTKFPEVGVFCLNVTLFWHLKQSYYTMKDCMERKKWRQRRLRKSQSDRKAGGLR